MGGVVAFSSIELVGVIGDRACSFLCLAEAEDSPCALIGCICGNEDLLCIVIVVDHGQAPSAHNELLDGLKRMLMFLCPFWEISISFSGCEWGENAHVLGKSW